jgi:hypothetical protein
MLQTVPDLLERARQAIGQEIIYKLGSGGLKPEQPSPANKDNECDCSGFAVWALHMSRMTNHPLYLKANGGWINTDSICLDARQSTGFFTEILQPRLGCLVVFPSNSAYGHIGIISEVVDNEITKVIHCSSSNYKKFGDAIQETSPKVFDVSERIFAWFDGITG